MSNKRIAVVTGAQSGLGRAIMEALIADDWLVQRFDLDNGDDVRNPRPEQLPDRIDLLVNCAGINRIAWLDDVTEDLWHDTMDTNAFGILRMVQACHQRLKESRGTVVNIVSNAAHMPMRCSAAYNASKGAALILTKQLARELISEGITVFSVSPNKLKGTGMSNDIDKQVCETRGWSMEEAQRYQLAGLLTGEETDPSAVAEFIAFLVSEKRRHKALAGCDLQYGL